MMKRVVLMVLVCAVMVHSEKITGFEFFKCTTEKMSEESKCNCAKDSSIPEEMELPMTFKGVTYECEDGKIEVADETWPLQRTTEAISGECQKFSGASKNWKVEWKTGCGRTKITGFKSQVCDNNDCASSSCKADLIMPTESEFELPMTKSVGSIEFYYECKNGKIIYSKKGIKEHTQLRVLENHVCQWGVLVYTKSEWKTGCETAITDSSTNVASNLFFVITALFFLLFQNLILTKMPLINMLQITTKIYYINFFFNIFILFFFIYNIYTLYIIFFLDL